MFSKQITKAATLLSLLTVMLTVCGSHPRSAQASHKLQQFRSGGHVLGFDASGVYVAGGDHVLQMSFAGANAVTPTPEQPPASDLQTQPLDKVIYTNLWDDISVVYEKTEAGIAKSSYLLDAGADPDKIVLAYNIPVRIDAGGRLVMHFASGTMTESAPIAWQEIDGHRVPVQVTFEARGERRIGFSLGAYDPTLPVVIDPTLQWHTFLGGSGFDVSYSIAVDGSNNIYVAGRSDVSWGLPVRSFTNGFDGFVAKLASDGSLTWHTFLGGNGYDEGYGIALDGSGNIYVAGLSDATWGAPVRSYSSGDDGFVAKLANDGSLVWHTFLGSASSDRCYGITVDASGMVYVTGNSASTWGSPVRSYAGDYDAFAAKLTNDGILAWNTFLGGSAFDEGFGIAVDGGGSIYIAGQSGASWGSPVAAYTAGRDGFVARLANDGSLTWNTFLGDNSDDEAHGIGLDGKGSVYVSGSSGASWGSPVHGNSAGGGFVAKLADDGSLTWNSFLSGNGGEHCYGLTVTAGGMVYVTGYATASWGSPLRSYTASYDAFAAGLASDGSLSWHTFLGGSGHDEGYGIAANNHGRLYVTGFSDAAWGSPVVAHHGGRDSFVAMLTDASVPVELLTFAAELTDDGVRLSWATASETENLGFHIYRSSGAEGEYSRLNESLIPGAGSSAETHHYSFTDATVEAGNTYWYRLADVDFNGRINLHDPIEVTVDAATSIGDGQGLPQTFALQQNYPNPFNPSTTISFALPQASEVSLAIYSLSGQLIKQLAAGQMGAGRHRVLWDGTDARGLRVASGVYLYVIRAGDYLAQKKLVLAK